MVEVCDKSGRDTVFNEFNNPQLSSGLGHDVSQVLHKGSVLMTDTDGGGVGGNWLDGEDLGSKL